MSIAAALANAASGLAATSRATEIVSSNVANAMTPGYARRTISQVATADSGGVRVVSVDRVVSASILADYRISTASAARANTITAYHVAMEDALGLNLDGDSLADRVAALEGALVAATSRPDDQLRLEAAAATVRDLVSAVNKAAEGVATARASAETEIANDVQTLSDALTSIARLNRSIIIEQANGRDTSFLIDERQRAIDSIAPIVAIREVPRENGRVALFTEGGAVLLDGDTPADISFSAVGYLSPSMQVGTPPVMRLAVDGEELSDRLMALFSGGSLEAQFRIRDEIAPKLQDSLDAFALELCERFSDPDLDPSIGAGAPGLFTDAGGSADPSTSLGLANRLTVNSALASEETSWALRDGLGAAAPGNEGDSTLLSRLADRLTEARPAGSPSFGAGHYDIAALAGEVGSRVSSARVGAQVSSAREGARESSLQMALLSEGVDTDAEMQRLLELETAYAANARVIAAIDAMIGYLLEM